MDPCVRSLTYRYEVKHYCPAPTGRPKKQTFLGSRHLSRQKWFLKFLLGKICIALILNRFFWLLCLLPKKGHFFTFFNGQKSNFFWSTRFPESWQRESALFSIRQKKDPGVCFRGAKKRKNKNAELNFSLFGPVETVPYNLSVSGTC